MSTSSLGSLLSNFEFWIFELDLAAQCKAVETRARMVPIRLRPKTILEYNPDPIGRTLLLAVIAEIH